MSVHWLHFTQVKQNNLTFSFSFRRYVNVQSVSLIFPTNSLWVCVHVRCYSFTAAVWLNITFVHMQNPDINLPASPMHNSPLSLVKLVCILRAIGLLRWELAG